MATFAVGLVGQARLDVSVVDFADNMAMVGLGSLVGGRLVADAASGHYAM